MAGPFDPSDRKCDWCSKPLVGRRSRWCSDPCGKEYWNNHSYSQARKVAKRRDKHRCVKCGSKDKLEVNHIVPCKGKHSRTGCYHHIENLETLCHSCHVAETNRQRAAGMFSKRKRTVRQKRSRRPNPKSQK